MKSPIKTTVDRSWQLDSFVSSHWIARGYSCASSLNVAYRSQLGAFLPKYSMFNWRGMEMSKWNMDMPIVMATIPISYIFFENFLNVQISVKSHKLVFQRILFQWLSSRNNNGKNAVKFSNDQKLVHSSLEKSNKSLQTLHRPVRIWKSMELLNQ